MGAACPDGVKDSDLVPLDPLRVSCFKCLSVDIQTYLCSSLSASFSTFPLPECIAALTLVHYTHQAASGTRVAYFRKYASPVQCSYCLVHWSRHDWCCQQSHTQVTVTVFWFFSYLFYFFSYFLSDKLQTDGGGDILSHINQTHTKTLTPDRTVPS